MQPREYVETGRHLPPFLSDFHDAKDFFKYMHRVQGDCQDGDESINWRIGCIYTIDHFLWFAAQHGWTLQRSRAAVEWRDLDDGIAAMKAEAAEAFRRALAERNQSATTGRPQP